MGGSISSYCYRNLVYQGVWGDTNFVFPARLFEELYCGAFRICEKINGAQHLGDVAINAGRAVHNVLLQYTTFNVFISHQAKDFEDALFYR